MDRMTQTAWRAFWIGLGAAAVLIGQTLLTPPAPATTAAAAAAAVTAPVASPRLDAPPPSPPALHRLRNQS